MTNVGPMGRRNEWEIYGIRNVSQFCKTTIKHELSRRAKEFFVEPKNKPNSTRGVRPGDAKGEETPTGHPVLQFSLFPTLSQRRARATPSENNEKQKDTDKAKTKDRRGKKREREREGERL